MSAVDEVAAAAAAIVAAFGAHDREAYFATFAPEATFLFHTSPRVMANRAEYEREWEKWERDGFRVLGCQSSDGQVQLMGNECAIFTHTVRTTLADGAGSIETGERETIVFALRDGKWIGVHEHLSPDPNHR
jgi:ketosteroid isomerase-like protein